MTRPQARRHLGIGAVAAASAQIGVMAATGITGVMVARELGAASLGTYTLVVTLIESAVVVGSLGIEVGLTYVAAHRGWDVRGSLRTSQAMALLLGLVAAGGGLAAYHLLPASVFEGVTPTMLLWALGSLPFALAWRFTAALALARERYELFTAASLTQAAGTLVLTLALIWSHGVLGAVVAYALSQAIAAVVMTAWVLVTAGPEAPSEGGGRLRQALAFGVKGWSANALQLLNYRLDIFIINAYAPRADLGLYAVAVSVVQLGWILPQALSTVLLPRTATLDASAGEGAEQARESDESASRAARHSVILALPTGAVLAIGLAAGIPIVYGGEFTDSVWLGLILLPGILALGTGKVVSAILAGRGRPIYALYTTLMVVPLTVAMYFLLIPEIGVAGAAVASTISYSLSTCIALLFTRRLTGLSMRDLLVPRRADIAEYAFAVRRLRERKAGS